MSIYDDIDAPDLEPDEDDKPKRSRKREPVEALTPTELRQGKRRLYDMVERAFLTLEQSLEKADWNNAVKAALGVLDRAGLGPKSTVDINTTTMDLSELTREELAERAAALATTLRATQVAAAKKATPSTTVN